MTDTFLTDRRRVELAAIPMLFLQVAGRMLTQCVESGQYAKAESPQPVARNAASGTSCSDGIAGRSG
jgi:hypothetical protein